jgi:hypothetical protein
MRTQSGYLAASQCDHFLPQNRQSFAFEQDDRTGLWAGVSVGTRKQSFAVCGLESHLSNVGATVEAACESTCHKLLGEMTKEMVEAFVDAKMEGAEMSVALYRVATDVGRPALLKQVNQQSRKAAEAMLETVPVITSPLTQCFQRWRAR